MRINITNLEKLGEPLNGDLIDHNDVQSVQTYSREIIGFDKDGIENKRTILLYIDEKTGNVLEICDA